MRRLLARGTLGTLALLLTLAGCGSDTSAESPPAEMQPVTLVSGTAGGGDAAAQTTDVTSDGDLASYVAQFDEALAVKVTAAAEKVDVGDGDALVAQVIFVGCDIPGGATVHDDVIVPAKIPTPMKECLAPVTTVALAAVPS